MTVRLEEMPYSCHTHHRYGDNKGGLVITAVTSNDYPERVIFTFMGKMLSELALRHPDFNKFHVDQKLDLPKLKIDFKKYQNPEEADQVMRIQKNLDDVKDVMHKNIQDILERGENLDNLMAKSEDLSTVSYKFYKQAKKTNSCCGL